MRKKIIWLAAFIALIAFILYFIHRQSFYFDVERIKEFVLTFGALGPIILIVINIGTIVFSPLTSFPFWLASLTLYGFWLTCFYVLIAGVGGAVANFLIARRFGRPIVAKLVGKKGIKMIDEFTEIVGLKTLFIARIFGSAATDYISYAAGLTSMPFKPYFLISFFVPIPGTILNIYVVDKALNLKPLYFLLFVVWGYVLAVGIPLIVYYTGCKSPIKGRGCRPRRGRNSVAS